MDPKARVEEITKLLEKYNYEYYVWIIQVSLMLNMTV